MVDPNVLILIKNPAKTEKGLLQQKIMAAYIDGYMTAQGELSRAITKMYKAKDPNATIVYNALEGLRETYKAKENEFINFMNDAALMDAKEE